MSDTVSSRLCCPCSIGYGTRYVSALPHGAAPNIGRRIKAVKFRQISMLPDGSAQTVCSFPSSRSALLSHSRVTNGGALTRVSAPTGPRRPPTSVGLDGSFLCAGFCAAAIAGKAATVPPV